MTSGYYVTITKELSKRTQRFTLFGTRLAIEKDLREMGYTMWEILAATFIAMTPEEFEKEKEIVFEF